MIELISVSKENKHILENMYQFYNDDLSEFTQEEINSSGLYEVDLEYYWQDSRRNPNRWL